MTSVDYSDFLALTLPEAVRYGRVVVATSLTDGSTEAVAKRCGAECFKTCAWNKYNAPFNKGAALNEALAYAKPDGWLLIMDSDILMMPPPPDRVGLNELDKTCLYSARRRSCKTEAQWKRCKRKKSWYSLGLDPLPAVRKNKVWGKRPTSNPIGIEGYFQLWHYPTRPIGISENRTAAKYDVALGLEWADEKRLLLPWVDYAVLHLGHLGRNWKGRKTERWRVSPAESAALEEAARKHHG